MNINTIKNKKIIFFHNNIMKKNFIYSSIIFLLMILLMIQTTLMFTAQSNKDIIVSGSGVSKTSILSDYFPKLKNSPGDTTIYFMEGKKDGGTLLLLGGVHANEPAGFIAAVLMIENAIAEYGRLIIVPQANASAYTHLPPREALPYKISIKTTWGERIFRNGDRLTNPIHQYPDPEVFVHYPSGQLLSSTEVRNLNRVFPGRLDGLLTEMIAYGITQLVIQENVDLVIDLHEARPMNPIVNCIIADDEAMFIAATAAMNMSMEENISIRLEPSATRLRGLSHRELADHTNALAFLVETGNPAMDSLRGPTNERLIVEGKDIFFKRAADHGGLIFVPYSESIGLPLDRRVGRHTSTILQLLNAYTEFFPNKPIIINNLPQKKDLVEYGIGYFLLKP